MFLDRLWNLIEVVCIAVFKISEDLDDWEFSRLLHIRLLLHCNKPIGSRVRLHNFLQLFLLFKILHANITASFNSVWVCLFYCFLLSVRLQVIRLEFWDCFLPVEIVYFCFIYRKILFFFCNCCQVRLLEVLSGVGIFCKTATKVSKRALFRIWSLM